LYKNSTIELKNRLVWRWQADATIWSMRVAPVTPILVVEVRDEILRGVHWVALDYAKKEKLWSTQPDKKEWWRHLDDVTKNRVVLRKFESTLNPDQTSQEYLSLDAGVRTSSGDHDFASHPRKLITLPDRYEEGSSEFIMVAEFLKRETGILATMMIEYLEIGEIIAIACYEKSADGFSLQLVMVKQGVIEVQQELLMLCKGIGSDVFFVADDLLFTISERKELLVYSIKDL
jgi:hypothetical protein